MLQISNIADLPLSPASGVPPAPLRLNRALWGALDRTIRHLNTVFTREGLGSIREIEYAPPRYSLNGDVLGARERGTSLALTALCFDDGSWWSASNIEKAPHHSLAIEAALRLELNQIITSRFDTAFRDVMAVFEPAAPRFDPNSKDHTAFVQAAMSQLFGQGLPIDGIYGPKTEAAVIQLLGISLQENGTWSKFLGRVIDTSLEGAAKFKREWRVDTRVNTLKN